jgi:hypothetical protein
MIAIDGTLQDRGRATQEGEARYRYVVEAKLVGPQGTMFSLMTEFMDMHDPVRDKEDCELNAFRRLAQRLRTEFPRLSICLLLDGLYPVQSVFDLCAAYNWKFIATHREGRQPMAWDEAVQTMLMSPCLVSKGRRAGEDGMVEQTLRWTHQVPFGKHLFQVLFSGEISTKKATLWVWVTNFTLTREWHLLKHMLGRPSEVVFAAGMSHQRVGFWAAFSHAWRDAFRAEGDEVFGEDLKELVEEAGLFARLA